MPMPNFVSKQKQKRMLGLRFDDDVWEVIESLAKQEFLTVAAWARRAVLAAIHEQGERKRKAG